MSISESFSKENIKKTFTYSTIAIASICALIGIIMIFAGPTIAMLSLLSTIFIFYVIVVVSIPSIRHLDDRSILIRTLSVVSLIMDAFWAIPWVMLVWDVFGSFDYYTRDAIWRLLWTAADISIFCTIIADCLAKIRWSSRIEKFFKSLPLICAGFLAFDFLVAIWFPEDSWELLFKFICAEIILVVLQIIVTQLLGQKMRQEADRERMIQTARAQREQQTNADTQNAQDGRDTMSQPSAQAQQSQTRPQSENTSSDHSETSENH